MGNIDIKAFSELIKQYRKEHKLTQGDFGKLINKTQVTVSNYEKDVHFPSDAEEISAIAQILNQPVSYIVDAIRYSRKGIIEENKAVLVELDKSGKLEDLQRRFKFLVNGEELTGEELKEALEFIKFKRFSKRDDAN